MRHYPRLYSPAVRVALASMMVPAALLACQPTAMAASPRDQAYLVCANGYEGDAGDCKRICSAFLKQSNNPLSDMRGTCLRRVNEKKSKGVPPPD